MTPRRDEGPAAKPDLHLAAAAPAPAAESTLARDDDDGAQHWARAACLLIAQLHRRASERGDRP